MLSVEVREKNAFDVTAVRNDFPILKQLVYGNPLIYLDNAATSQKPQVVIDTLVDYYSNYNANIHRGVHFLSQKASQAYDEIRIKVKHFINAESENEIIFTKGTTESINLVASTFGRKFIRKGNEIIISAMEHHSNIVPWQLLCEEKGATLKVIPVDDNGELILSALDDLISESTSLIAVVHTSNSLGTVNDVRSIIEKAHQYNIPVLVDAAQAMVHEPVDVRDLDCDFLAFSAHKMLGPTGVGCLYGKMKLLEEMPPYQGGGDMIKSVSFEKTIYNDVPYRFEAGTPNVADVIAFGAAIDYINAMEREGAHQYEMELLHYATHQLKSVDGIRIIGNAGNKTSVISFIIEGVNALDAGMFLDTKGIAVRTGHHCTEPVMARYCIPGTIRASFLFYNTKSEIDAMIIALQGAVKLLRSAK